MNEQAPLIFSQILLFVFIGVFIYNMVCNPTSCDLDHITVGYFDSQDVDATITVHTVDEALVKDCKDLLVAMGVKKSASKKITNKIFDEHNPETIEDFIKIYSKSV